ncbi:site-specific integrase [Streptomyces sp. T21Q-yed]|nr:site-specific integrase [Streptomyces sp. T21Q-yed]MDF3148874.1 site-specific integrase [Streptomyces sp. T21Q-yed]WDF43036.1 site-specific integrase [Streptomyces sp. T12]
MPWPSATIRAGRRPPIPPPTARESPSPSAFTSALQVTCPAQQLTCPHCRVGQGDVPEHRSTHQAGRPPASVRPVRAAPVFAACTAARSGEVSGCRVGDIDTTQWIWTVRRQTTPAPGGLTDKGTKGKRARRVPIVEEIRPLIAQRVLSAGPNPDARLFTGPRGGRISTAVLRDATHWDDAVAKLGYEHLRRHDLRHTGLTWFADAGVQVHVLRRIAGHGSLTTTQRYLHPDVRKITAVGAALSAHFSALRAPRSLPSPIVMTR